ncbi:D-alanyl-D-alanine carboxypeptidase family protein [Mycolicibacterium diernhoferi]|uniref:D-alanyl-D-alanine carboxypeptidase n=1 Tax=Mycolicibacterium diernhoferi TaxID=1801 RepID=A0A1Q4HGK6_9MYCO|nr:D-alanyl-D-alanine carboxypeptidase family protein [Mycolicibacterium diernhoferi]OJZ66552.1 D-alanyl-D-alanine carboxypeptidase [Mycolicibacterium diernhoferi]OPE48142.1 D-alanyl-D-alanine carboxypeptidase [Mycolicibacterium diernhoferi]PEG56429.1 D-alanyl-D-alanine carboxypeptidase [Mycolicibacterium diernhoferi]QYL24737.1 D-alanyl-D-alanine carboxypeptidase [Mycolicibacterium diernhoferi]
MRRLAAGLISALCLLTVSTGSAGAVPGVDQPLGSVPIPDGPAQAWVIADMDSGAVLASRDGYGRYAPASTIKVLLATVVLEELPLEATVVAEEADTRVECNCAGVAPGQTYTVRQLLEGLLLVSGNDAANTLATMLGGREAAVAKMNAKAAQLGAHATVAGSPSGLDGPGIEMWSSPHDLAVLFRAALADPVFGQITAQPTAVFPGRTGDRVLVNQNELLGRYPGTLGGKTGFTDLARKTFVGAAQRDGRRLVVALMYGLVREGGPTYWDQASALLDWGFVQDRSAGIGVL